MNIFIIACIIFVIGYDTSSYTMMRHVDKTYKKRNIWLLGYNTYMVWKTAKSAKRKQK